jgi:hypothetical protein
MPGTPWLLVFLFWGSWVVASAAAVPRSPTGPGSPSPRLLLGPSMPVAGTDSWIFSDPGASWNSPPVPPSPLMSPWIRELVWELC